MLHEFHQVWIAVQVCMAVIFPIVVSRSHVPSLRPLAGPCAVLAVLALVGFTTMKLGIHNHWLMDLPPVAELWLGWVTAAWLPKSWHRAARGAIVACGLAWLVVAIAASWQLHSVKYDPSPWAIVSTAATILTATVAFAVVACAVSDRNRGGALPREALAAVAVILIVLPENLFWISAGPLVALGMTVYLAVALITGFVAGSGYVVLLALALAREEG